MKNSHPFLVRVNPTKLNFNLSVGNNLKLDDNSECVVKSIKYVKVLENGQLEVMGVGEFCN